MKTKLTAMAAMLAASALVLAGCASDSSTSTPADNSGSNTTDSGSTSTEAAVELSGNIIIDGSSTVGPAAEVAAELFMERNPGVRVSVNISGTGGGFSKFCNKETDGSNASRFIKSSEEEACQANGVNYDFVTVANDALSVVVNKDNPLQCISIDQLNTMWNSDATRTVMKWGDVPGMPSAIADIDITPYGPGASSGTFDFFTEEVTGEAGNIRLDYIDIGEDDLRAVTGVQGSLGGIGFIPYSYYQEYLNDVKALAVDGGNGCIEPSLENVQNLSYAPLGRGLFTYFSDVALQRPEVVAFAEFLVNESKLITETAGFVGLTPAQQAEQLAAIARLAGK